MNHKKIEGKIKMPSTVASSGPDLGLVRPQGTVTVGPQPLHTPAISIMLLKFY